MTLRISKLTLSSRLSTVMYSRLLVVMVMVSTTVDTVMRFLTAEDGYMMGTAAAASRILMGS